MPWPMHMPRQTHDDRIGRFISEIRRVFYQPANQEDTTEMSFEHKEGSGSLFRNDRKQPGEKTPDYRGEIKLNGEIIKIAGWIREGQRGKFLSLKVDLGANFSIAGGGSGKQNIEDSEFPF
jgi:hypothetical protein